ncbi:hypothetical protein JKP88DRAFT_202931 [Tribonema minus]|uniref:Dynein regulatory complex protein 12 n=1 Tax=Tribonema minus TaxID=303371 RepID=A0A835YNC3_9STRA|nr:hypothetical protein JKP88DRAFT_202931 [Tribonema minus]
MGPKKASKGAAKGKKDGGAENGEELTDADKAKLLQSALNSLQIQLGEFAITRDMTRQYKGMQEELLNRINQLEGVIQALQDSLENARMDVIKVTREKDATIEAKDKELAMMRLKMEDMAQEFGDMLKETLDRMRERIEVNSAGFEPEDPVPLQRRMEEVGTIAGDSTHK